MASPMSQVAKTRNFLSMFLFVGLRLKRKCYTACSRMRNIENENIIRDGEML